MSEYQYYEFQAIDRPLGREEMQILRGYSTRARITTTGFVNEYSFGSFKGDADQWMAKYFGNEPPVPAGLNSLSPALVALIDFLEIDRDLVSAAAAGSPDLIVPNQDRAALERWVAELPAPEKNDLLLRILEGNESQIGMELRNRFEQGLSKRNPPRAAPPRTAGELLAAAKRARTFREQADARRAAEEEARRVREAAAAREKHLELLTTRVPQVWAKVEELVSTRQTKAYAEAVQMLLDLREITARRHAAPDFDRRMAEIRAAHAKKRAFIEQLDAGGLG